MFQTCTASQTNAHRLVHVNTEGDAGETPGPSLFCLCWPLMQASPRLGDVSFRRQTELNGSGKANANAEEERNNEAKASQGNLNRGCS